MVASKLKLLFLISTIFSEHNNGISMTLHMRRNERFVAQKDRANGGIYERNKRGNESLYFPSDFMEYYIKVSVGTPAQDVFLVMDTGSSLVWVPCTQKYTCNNCPQYSTVFLPRNSSSAVPVKCADPKCKDLCVNEGCIRTIENCSGVCPDYVIYYGSGSTTGHLFTETLTLPVEDHERGKIKNFGVGCSVVSSGFAGIAGFGRGGLSMPSQLSSLLGDRFAYCLDDLNNGSMILLGDIAVPKEIPLTYTPFLNNQVPSFGPSSKFYYIALEAVSIGGKRLTLPANLLRFDSNGNGGTIIDSGTSYTFFPEAVYKKIVGEFASQIGYRRVHAAGYGLCYNVSGASIANILLPQFVFHFKGGSDMVLPHENSFVAANTDNFLAASSDTICLAIENAGSEPDGPAVVFGNFQQKNFYLLYDRLNNRLGFAQQPCKAFR